MFSSRRRKLKISQKNLIEYIFQIEKNCHFEQFLHFPEPKKRGEVESKFGSLFLNSCHLNSYEFYYTTITTSVREFYGFSNAHKSLSNISQKIQLNLLFGYPTAVAQQIEFIRALQIYTNVM